MNSSLHNIISFRSRLNVLKIAVLLQGHFSQTESKIQNNFMNKIPFVIKYSSLAGKKKNIDIQQLIQNTCDTNSRYYL